MSAEHYELGEQDITPKQEQAIQDLCASYRVEYDRDHYQPAFDLPVGWLAGWVGGPGYDSWSETPTIYIGVSGEGEVHS